jgi:hypothetical protein
MMDKAGNTAQSAKESCQEVQKSFFIKLTITYYKA